MKSKKFSFDYLSLLKYAVLFFVFLVFNKLETQVLPYSLGIFVAFLYSGGSLIFTPILFLASFLALGNTGLLISMSLPAVLFVILFLIYKKFNYQPKYELVAICLLSLSVFLIIGDTNAVISLEKKVFTSILILTITFLSLIFCNAFNKKGLKIILNPLELAVFFTLTILFGVGLSNFTSPLVWKTISAMLILFTAFFYKKGTAGFFACILGVSYAVYYTNLTFIAVFLALSLSATLFMPISRHLSSVAIIITDLILQLVFNVYSAFAIEIFVPTAIASLTFSFFPKKVLLNLKETLYTFREKQLVRKSINQNRSMLSNRLFELSSVFNEMSDAIVSFQKNNLDSEGVKKSIATEIVNKVCAECGHRNKCLNSKTPSSLDLFKLMDIGFAKGKISVIDVPSGISDNCLNMSNMIFVANKMLAEYRKAFLENENHNQSRRLVADLSYGVSEILSGLALDTGIQLKYQNKIERALFTALKQSGFNASELMIFGEEGNLRVSIILCMREFSLSVLEDVVSKTIGEPFILYDRSDITEDKYYLLFKKSPEYDAIFGVTNLIKDGSSFSGDTHSVNKLHSDKFLVALSDGMGSGEYAKKVSSASLSLIESFYKANVKSELVLQTVNKLLSINTEDTFTALDIAVIDLNSGLSDFIKYGSPYGFIISDNGIRIIEGNSLPLGILSELKPSVCTAPLADGDMILFVTDGVSDAFKSANEIIDFLKSTPAKNPQTLTDKIIEKAVSISNGAKADDMTALAVRIFKRLDNAC